jgi:3-oxoacyl-[acyl-carrier protein] reductase
LEKKTVIVTGGSRGLGKSIIEGFIKTGNYNICTLSRKKTDFIKKMEKNHSDIFFYEAVDVQDLEKLKAFVDNSYKKFGRIDMLVNNVGVAFDAILMTQSNSDIEVMLDVNLKSLVVITKYVIRKMILKGGGKIVNISSIVGLTGFRGLSVYSSTKAAIDGFTRSLAREMGSKNILVNSVAPGFIETEMSQELTETQLKQIRRRTPLGRLGVPEDIVPMILFLSTDEANFITGQTFIVDGGITI